MAPVGHTVVQAPQPTHRWGSTLICCRDFSLLIASAEQMSMQALQLLLQDLTIDAATALDWGLVTEVVAPDALASRAEQVARFWLDNSTGSFGQAKRLVRTGAGRLFAENLDDEAHSIGARFDTDESKARVAAFAAASRKPASPPRQEQS